MRARLATFMKIFGLVGFLITSFGFSTYSNASTPSIYGRTADNKLFILPKNDGRPKIINFFWVDCVPCREEIPYLAKKEKNNPNVDVYLIHAAEEPESKANYDIKDINQFISTLSASPKNIVLGSPTLKESWGIIGFPYTVLIDENQNIVKRLNGYTPENIDIMTKWLESL